MNTISLSLDEINITLPLFKPVVKSLVHTLLFLRLVERVVPRDTSPSVFETIDYVMNSKYSFEDELEKIRGLFRKKKFVQLTISFYRIIKEAGWFSTEEKVEWERWTIPIRQSHTFESEQPIRDAIAKIHNYCDSYSEHVSFGKNTFLLYDASEEKGWTFADLSDLLRKGPPDLF